jgi:hypothetical protein
MLDICVFSQEFLTSLNQLKSSPRITIDSCYTFDDAALLLPTIRNVTSLGAQLSVPHTYNLMQGPSTGEWIPRRKGCQRISDPDLTGSNCLLQVLTHNPGIQNLDLRLGLRSHRGRSLETTRWFSVLGSHLVNLRTLTLSGKFQHPPEPSPVFEQLQSLSIMGDSLITFVTTSMRGCFPVLDEFRVNSNELKLGHGGIKKYYSGDQIDFSKFLASIPLQQLVMCGFRPEYVPDYLHSLRQFEYHDMDIFSSLLQTFPQDLEPYTGGYGPNRDENMNLVSDIDFERFGPLRWPALAYLNQLYPIMDFSQIHSQESFKLYSMNTLGKSGHNLAVFGIDIERCHLITDVSEIQEPQRYEGEFVIESRQERRKRELMEKFSGKFETASDYTAANFDLLEKLCLLSNVQQINLHLTKIMPQNYWLLTAKEAVQTFCYLQSRKVGKPLLKLHIADTFCGIRYLVRYIGSKRIIVDVLRNLRKIEARSYRQAYSPSTAQVWETDPIHYLFEQPLDLRPVEDSWALNI